jgi:hypothetical protein
MLLLFCAILSWRLPNGFWDVRGLLPLLRDHSREELAELAGCGKTGVCSEIFFCIRIWFWTETVGSEVYLVDKGFLFGF